MNKILLIIFLFPLFILTVSLVFLAELFAPFISFLFFFPSGEKKRNEMNDTSLKSTALV